MKKILAFAGSNSNNSINHHLVSAVAQEITEYQVDVLKLTDYPLPIYDIDLEASEGFPSELKLLLDRIKSYDGLLISVNEHNGTVSAFFKNVTDWLSRIEYKFLEGKKVFLMSASPGKRGGLSALEYTKGVLPRYGAEVIEALPFPSFSENFSTENNRITKAELAQAFAKARKDFIDSLE